MGQKVDLRIQKTQKAIREAFLEIRGRQPLEKVTVREICQRAMINTSTFYNHYRDVTNLTEQLESELLDACFRSMPSLDDLFTDPYRFLAELRRCFSDSREAEDLSILFDGRYETFYQKIDKSTLFCCSAINPQPLPGRNMSKYPSFWAVSCTPAIFCAATSPTLWNRWSTAWPS